MSSQDEEDDVQDELIDEYSEYTSQSSSYKYIKQQSSEKQQSPSSSDENQEKEDDQKFEQTDHQESQADMVDQMNDQYQQSSVSHNVNSRYYIPPNSADDEEIVKLCLQKAVKINEKIITQRKLLKEQFKEFQSVSNAARNNIKDYDMPYQTAHFPLYLKTNDKFILLPAQNLNIRKGTVESFIKTNLENENQVKRAEQERRIAFKQRRPYQRRKFDG